MGRARAGGVSLDLGYGPAVSGNSPTRGLESRHRNPVPIRNGRRRQRASAERRMRSTCAARSARSGARTRKCGGGGARCCASQQSRHGATLWVSFHILHASQSQAPYAMAPYAMPYTERRRLEAFQRANWCAVARPMWMPGAAMRSTQQQARSFCHRTQSEHSERDHTKHSATPRQLPLSLYTPSPHRAARRSHSPSLGAKMLSACSLRGSMKARWMIICGSSGSLRRQEEPSVKRLPMGWSSSWFMVCEPRLSILSVTSMNLPSAWRERRARTGAADERERACVKWR